MDIGQVPTFSLPEDSKRVTESLGALIERTADRNVPGASRVQLFLQAAALEREWNLQERQAAKEPWVTGYRQISERGWLAVHLGSPSESSEAKAPKPTWQPDPIAVLCPSDQVAMMLESAQSMLILCPAQVLCHGSERTLNVLPGPCLTLVHGFLSIAAHMIANELPTFPLSSPPHYPSAIREELLRACASTRDCLGSAIHCWVPLLPGPMGDSSLEY